MATVDINDWDEKNIGSVGDLSDDSSFTGLNKVQPIKIVNSELTSNTESIDHGGETNNGDDPASFDVELLKSSIISTVGFDVFSSDTVTVDISDGENTIASKSVDANENEWTEVSFGKSDYSKIPDNETLTVTISGESIYNGSETYDGELFNINDQSDFPYYYDGGSDGGTALTVTEVDKTGSGTGSTFFSSSAWDNVSDKEDIVVTEADESTTRPYEIKSLDTDKREAWIWVYGSWDSDDSDQVVIGLGGGDGTDYSMDGDGDNPWGESGVNAEIVLHLDEDPLEANDSSPNGNDGTIDGAIATSDGVFNGAGDFDGSDDQIDIADSSSLDITNEITVISWVLGRSQPQSTQGIISKRESYNDNNPFELSVLSIDSGNDDGRLAFRIQDGDENSNLETPDDSVGIDENYQFVGRFSESESNIEAFIDGVSEASETRNNDLPTNNQDVRIGETHEGGEHLDGVIDAVRVYSDYKSTDWIQADYDASPKGGQEFFSWSGAEKTGVETLSGSAEGEATASATITNKYTFSGSATGEATATGTLYKTVGVTGSATGTGTATGDATKTITFQASATGEATATGIELTEGSIATLSGSATGSATATGHASKKVTFTASASGAGESSGNLKIVNKLIGSAEGNAVSSADLFRRKTIRLSGNAEGEGSATGSLFRFDLPRDTDIDTGITTSSTISLNIDKNQSLDMEGDIDK